MIVIKKIGSFIRVNYQPLLLVVFLMISECIWLPFSSINHHDNVSLGVVLYHFFAQIGYVSLLPSLFLYRMVKDINAKGLYLGIFVWNCIEVLQEINTLCNFEIYYLGKSESAQSDMMQCLFIVSIVVLVFFSYKKRCST